MPGPLAGIRVIEFAGIGPAPFAGMLLADQGAQVLCIGRRDGVAAPGLVDATRDVLNRGKLILALDLKDPGDVALALDLIGHGDALIEGFRPGVMERLGIGPDTCLARNPRLIYGRMTGWGQSGPLASVAGHDIDYIALSGALYPIGCDGTPPPPPLNLVGDFGGGGMQLAFGVVSAVLEARQSGRGQVVDAAMTDGSALLMAMIYGLKGMGQWQARRQHNFLDGAAPFYRCYRCADGKFIAVGAIEPRFYKALLAGCGIDDPDFAEQWDRLRWPRLSEKLAQVFARRSRDEWCAGLTYSDACVAPVLDLDEAPEHPHNAARGTYLKSFGVCQPAPAPRFSRTVADRPRPPTVLDDCAWLGDWGVDADTERRLRQRGIR